MSFISSQQEVAQAKKVNLSMKQAKEMILSIAPNAQFNPCGGRDILVVDNAAEHGLPVNVKAMGRFAWHKETMHVEINGRGGVAVRERSVGFSKDKFNMMMGE